MSVLHSLVAECVERRWIVAFSKAENLSPPYMCYISNVFPIDSVHPKRLARSADSLLAAMRLAIDGAYEIEASTDPDPIYATPPAEPKPDLLALLNLRPKPVGTIRRL